MLTMMASQDKRKRAPNMEEGEKKPFLDIFKQADGGKLWKVIYEGSANKTELHDVWQKIDEIFSRETHKPFNYAQAKAKWGCIKAAAKKKYDTAAIDREFKKQCSKTGGGAPPQIPPSMDADEEQLDFDDLEPTATNFNQLVRPLDRMSVSAGGLVDGRAVEGRAEDCGWHCHPA